MKEKIKDFWKTVKIILWTTWLGISLIPTAVWYFITKYLVKHRSWAAYRLCAAADKFLRVAFKWLDYMEHYAIEEMDAPDEEVNDFIDFLEDSKDWVMDFGEGLEMAMDNYLKAGAH